ncbi:peroxisome assembly protein (Peroxin-2) [Coemansia sp. RSA 2706]|nr:peroxisome assembly protein (Peroxin-2) [Coemansia sp. RSA 2708]KAJ2303873.1 peroxisome assembly protein (Peroxin-2) [Coemansia sp. RSA 2706]KAJ2309022.1 peroxisome assembly protein (Peroxin-2) [Coemansia sp. RSA 2705]KAJ2326213.1 peroxisome assembly protein (Peroxin-2) [Coemansia sp. RSA 2702]
MSTNGPQWAGAWTSALSRIEPQLAQVPAPVVPRSARVSKLDAELLDAELTDMLREPVTRAMSLLRPGLADRYRLEIDTAISALLFCLSAGSARRATYGQGLQNLRYAGSGRGFVGRIYLFGALSIGGRYAWARMVEAMSLRGWADAPRRSARGLVWRLAQRVERLVKVLAVLNFVAFLGLGQYKTLAERVLGLRLVYARPQLAHSVSFEFLNRQLVWHAFTEFVMFALPLVNPSRARAWLVRNARALLRLPAVKVDPEVAALPEDACAVCFVDAKADAPEPQDAPSAAVNAYVTNCGHRYCYVCIRTRMMAEADECACLRCGAKVERIRQYVER